MINLHNTITYDFKLPRNRLFNDQGVLKKTQKKSRKRTQVGPAPSQHPGCTGGAAVAKGVGRAGGGVPYIIGSQ